MTRTRHAFACILTAFLALTGFAQSPALAQTDFPKQPVHFIVGFAAGGGNDLFARVVVQKLQENTGITTVIENKVGAGGRIAADYAARATPDAFSSDRGYSGAAPRALRAATTAPAASSEGEWASIEYSGRASSTR